MVDDSGGVFQPRSIIPAADELWARAERSAAAELEENHVGVV
jgi:hypothetical protein